MSEIPDIPYPSEPLESHETVEMTDLERLVELVRLVADDPDVKYKPDRTFVMARNYARGRTSKRRRDLDKAAAEVLAWAAPKFAKSE
jgi:hypothetical protein